MRSALFLALCQFFSVAFSYSQSVDCGDINAVNYSPSSSEVNLEECLYAIEFLLKVEPSDLLPAEVPWLTGPTDDWSAMGLQLEPHPTAPDVWVGVDTLGPGQFQYVYTIGNWSNWELELDGSVCDSDENLGTSYRELMVEGPETVSDCWNCECVSFQLGCISPEACNFDDAATVDSGTCAFAAAGVDCNGNCLDSNADGTCDYGLTLAWELHETGLGPVVDADGAQYDLTGYETYRLYVQTQENFIIDVVGAFDGMDLSFSSSGQMHNSPIGSAYAQTNNTLLFDLFPSLAVDSWWTIGVENAVLSDDECELEIVTDTNQNGFFDSGNWASTGDVSIGGPMMYVLPNCANAIPDENNRVLIGQFTTNGVLAVTLGVRGLDENSEAYSTLLSAVTGTADGCPDPEACNYAINITDTIPCDYPDALGDCSGNCAADANSNGLCDSNEVQGCTSSTACNFAPSATFNDGSCVFATPVSPCAEGPCISTIAPIKQPDDLGGVVEVSGIVTGVYPFDDGSFGNHSSFTMQSCTGAYSGIWVRGIDNSLESIENVQLGDEVEVSGGLDSWFGLGFLGEPEINILSSGNPLPEAQTLNSVSVNLEEWEGALVSVTAECVNPDNGFGTWLVDDGSGVAQVNDRGFDAIGEGLVESGRMYRITAPTGYAFGNWSIEPREASDIVPVGCTDPTFPNYWSLAEEDDGTCIQILGCTDAGAGNFNSAANEDDGSCEIIGCTDQSAFNFNPTATIADNASCVNGHLHLSMLTDPNDNSNARFVKISNPSDEAVDLTGWSLKKWLNGNMESNSSVALSEVGVLEAGSCAYIANSTEGFEAAYGFLPNLEGGSAVSTNGDDQVALVYSDTLIVDLFGVIGEDGTNTCHEFEDGYALRLNELPSGDNWNQADWIVYSDASYAFGCDNHFPDSPQNAIDIATLIQDCTNTNPCADLDGNGTCDEDEVPGCTDDVACNYMPEATLDDGSCVTDTDGDGICDPDEIEGCTDSAACNFDPNATDEDGSCFDVAFYDLATCQCLNDVNFNTICDEYELFGCTNPGACNFDSSAGIEDGSCQFAIAGYDCEGHCILQDTDLECLDAIQFACARNSLVAAEGNIYAGAPEDIPSFYAVDASLNLSSWGVIPNSPWPDSHPILLEINQNIGGIYSGAWGTTILVSSEGTILNPGEINTYGVYLPPLQDVVKVDNGEFQVLVLDAGGDCHSFGFDDPMANFSVPFDVVMADIIDIACTLENNIAVDSEGEIYVWGASGTIGELGYGMPLDVVGNWMAVDGTWSEIVGITDAGDAAVWPYDASLTDNWKTQFNAHDWLADPAVDAKIAQNWVCVLTQSGELIHFSSSSFVSENENTYEELMPPSSFGPVVDFDISQSGLIAKNANGQIHSAFVPIYTQENFEWLDEFTVINAVPSNSFSDPLCILGCTESWATNFSPSANEDDGSCLLAGCTEPMACNFDPLATTDDGSCELPDIFDCDGVTCLNDINNNGICDELEVPGCHIATACNFDPEAVLGDINLCEFPEPWRDCEGNCLLDLNGDGTCDRMTDYLCGVGEIIQVDPYQSGPSGLFKTARILVEGGYYEVADSILNLSFNSLEGDIQGLIGTPVQSYGGEGAGVWVVGVGRDSLLQDLNLPASFVSAAEAEEGFDATPTTLKFASVEAGRQYFVGVDSAGNLHGWGALEPEFAPTIVPAFTNVTAVDADEDGVAAVNASGATYWGSHFQYPLLEIPAYVLDAPEDIVELELSYQNGFALMSDGDVIPWGTFNEGYTVVPDHLDSVIRMTSVGPISYDVSTIGLLDADGHIGLMDFGSPTLSNAVFSNIIAMSPGMTQGRFLALRGDGVLIECQLDTYTDEYTLNILELPDFSPVLCIPGCMDTSATNFQELATWDDGNCLYEGCTDPSAFNYDEEAVNDDGSCVTSGCVDPDACNYEADAKYGLRLEKVTVHDGFVGDTDLSGYTTYRLYVDLQDSADFVSAVYGNELDTLSLFTSGDFYQNVLGGSTPNGINPILYPAFPELEFDSWVTIGIDQVPSTGNQAISTVEDNASPWILPFEMGTGFEVNTITGGSWYIVNNGSAINGVAGVDRTVLLGQFTTNGDLFGELQVQFFPGGMGSAYELLSLPIEDACAYSEPFYNCLNLCLNDSDGDGVCDELEVPGCMDTQACNFSPLATDSDGSCRFSSGEASLLLQAYEVHEGMSGTDDLSGFTTYRLFAELDQPEDQLLAVFGDSDNEMSIQSTSSFWQHPVGALTGDGIQSALLATFPSLAYDSYVTIGATEFIAGNGQVELAESPNAGDQWLPSFLAGGNIEINSVTGGGWFVVPGGAPFPNTLPDDSGRVLLGQFTTQGLMFGQLNVQLEACGAGTVQVLDLDFGVSPELIGCTDPDACNYSELAAEDDGSCCFEYCLKLYSPDANLVNRQSGDTLVSVDRFDGTREFCLPTGCFLTRGNQMDSVLFDGTVLFLTADSLLITAGNVLCDACKNERACNYDSAAIFDNEDCAMISADLDVPPNFNVGISDLLSLLSDFGCQINCAADINGDDQVGALDLLDMLGVFGDDCESIFSGCTDPSACNYSPADLFNNGSCIYPDLEGDCD